MFDIFGMSDEQLLYYLMGLPTDTSNQDIFPFEKLLAFLEEPLNENGNYESVHLINACMSIGTNRKMKALSIEDQKKMLRTAAAMIEYLQDQQ